MASQVTRQLRLTRRPDSPRAALAGISRVFAQGRSWPDSDEIAIICGLVKLTLYVALLWAVLHLPDFPRLSRIESRLSVASIT